MFSRSAFKAAVEVRLASTPQTLSIASRRAACLHQSSTSTQFQATQPEIPPQDPSSTAPKPPQSSQIPPQPQFTQSTTKPKPRGPPTNEPPSPPTFTSPLTLPPSLTTLLPHLTTQKPHYITAHLHSRPYLLTEGDTLRLPFLMPDVSPGDIIRLNRASNLGSRDFTLKGNTEAGSRYLDERLFECRVRVIGTESEPLRIKEKTKRRQRHVKTVKSKHRYTIMRVVDVKVKGVEELVAEGAKVVETDGEGTEAKVEEASSSPGE
ncbi:hypothetical protein FQN54_003469 [Arachnomyces sp. PD_36]|nr:hypothetical protein FQN54_003469 [Arachnomyces sp. PD_36]